jgi:hypothetical protein
MPDIDPNQIPTLDDVIDQDETEDESPAESGIDTLDNIESEQESSEPGLSEPEPPEQESSDTESPELTDQQADDEQTSSIEDTEHDTQEPVADATATEETQDSFPRELPTDLAFSYQQPYAFLGNPVAKRSHANHTEQPADARIDADTLNEVIESTVKTLLPDLEQQLRFLIERALREKLPDELIANDEVPGDSTDQIN